MQLLSALALLAALAACAAVKPQPSVETYEQALAPARPGGMAKVQEGDTVYGIARRNNVSMRDLIALNGLKPPFRLAPGTPLTLPARDGGVTPVIIESPAPAAALQPLSVESPDLAGVPTYRQIVPVPREKEEAFSPPLSDAPGQMTATTREKVIYAPVQQEKMDAVAKESLARAPVSAPAPASTPVAGPKSKDSQVAEVTRNLNLQPLEFDNSRQQLKPPVFRKDADVLNALKSQPQIVPKAQRPVVAAGKGGRFGWPVQGQVISGFGPKAGGLRNDGVNIGVPRGTPVMAADGGTIAYAGSDIPGYGNVVLVRHADGWMTTYAHLERIYVQRDAVVGKGDMLGTAGTSGGLTTPQLHFEIRQGSEALNPERQLPGL